MEFTINDSPYNTNLQRFNLQTRRLRLISDLIEDYQDNMSRAMGLIEFEMGMSTNTAVSSDRRTSRGVDEWLANLLPTTNEVPRHTSNSSSRGGGRMQNSLFDNTYPLSSNANTNANIRRGFIYTQLVDPPTTSTDAGISSQDIESATELIQYDASMNETRCPITWDAFEPGQNILRVNSCGHIFGQHALLEWCHRHSKCPVCRTNIISDGSDNNATSTSSYSDSTRQSSRTTSSTSSNIIGQLMSGILNGVNGSLNSDSGYYESSMTFGVNDLIDAYAQLTQTPSTVSTESTRRTSTNQNHS
jgi:hypothetical protein